jgi:hypothetical protein
MKLDIACVLVGVVASLIILKLLYTPKTTEHYDPRAMGSRKYWGFGRTYGYSFDDHEELDNFCYQITPDTRCMPGYTLKFNSFTSRGECCVDRSNYGIW